MSTTERLRDTERRLDEAGDAVDGARRAVGTAADAAETVDRWRSSPVAIIASAGILAALVAAIWWMVGRSDE